MYRFRPTEERAKLCMYLLDVFVRGVGGLTERGLSERCGMLRLASL